MFRMSKDAKMTGRYVSIFLYSKTQSLTEEILDYAGYKDQEEKNIGKTKLTQLLVIIFYCLMVELQLCCYGHAAASL